MSVANVILLFVLPKLTNTFIRIILLLLILYYIMCNIACTAITSYSRVRQWKNPNMLGLHGMAIMRNFAVAYEKYRKNQRLAAQCGLHAVC